MKTNSISTTGGGNLIVIILGIVAALLVFAVLTGRKVPLLSSDRAVLLALVVIGMAICSQGGIGRVAASRAWLHPLPLGGCKVDKYSQRDPGGGCITWLLSDPDGEDFQPAGGGPGKRCGL